jgi:cytochrome c oxidase subunit 2
VGLQVPKISGVPARRALRVALLGVTMLVLAGCSEADTHQIKNLAMPDRITEQGPYTYELWKWAWVAAMVTGVIVWGLIFYTVVKFRRRSDDEVPRQTRYNLPLEVFYTIAPVLMCIVFFFHTVRVQDVQTELSTPDVTVEVTGQQWSWTFNHGVGEQNPDATGEDGDYAYESYVYTSGDASEIPTLVLPVDQRIPSFLTRMDVIPGRVNRLQVTPTVEGDYRGKCYELCGVYHSRMLFEVKVVSQADYEQYLSDLADAGQTSDKPITGGANVETQTGLGEDDNQEGTVE